MSHASGKVKFKDGTIRYVEYNGTCDSIYPLSYKTKKEMNDNWRANFLKNPIVNMNI